MPLNENAMWISYGRYVENCTFSSRKKNSMQFVINHALFFYILIRVKFLIEILSKMEWIVGIPSVKNHQNQSCAKKFAKVFKLQLKHFL